MKSTTIIYSREGAIYLNVAPKPVMKANEKPSLDRTQSSDNSPPRAPPLPYALQPPPLPLKHRREKEKRSSVPTGSKTHPIGKGVPSKSMEMPRQNGISPSRSMPAVVGQSPMTPGLPAKRVDFTKQPLPKTSSPAKTPSLALPPKTSPVSPRPVRPLPYSKTHKAHARESAEGYAYVDPAKCRYLPLQDGLSRDLDGLDLDNAYASSEFVCVFVPVSSGHCISRSGDSPTESPSGLEGQQPLWVG